MKLKIGHDNLLFKITEEELVSLDAGKTLHEAINISGNRLIFIIEPSGDKNDIMLDYNYSTIRMIISPASVRRMLEQGRSKEGLNSNQDGLSIALQVDVRSYNKNNKAA
jgi:hypothetical protein